MAIFGNRAVINTDAFGSIARDRVVRLEPPVLDAVHAMYNDIALFGKRGTPIEVAFLERAAGLTPEQGRELLSSIEKIWPLSTVSDKPSSARVLRLRQKPVS